MTTTNNTSVIGISPFVGGLGREDFVTYRVRGAWRRLCFCMFAVGLTLLLTSCENGKAKKAGEAFLDALVKGDTLDILHTMPHDGYHTTQNYSSKGVVNWRLISFDELDGKPVKKDYNLDALPEDASEATVKNEEMDIIMARSDYKDRPEEYKIIADTPTRFAYEKANEKLRHFKGVYEVTYIDRLGETKSAKVELYTTETWFKSGEYRLERQSGL